MHLKPEIQSMVTATFNTPSGKRTLQWLETKVNRLTIDPHKPDPNAAVFKAAQIALVNEIKKYLIEENKDD